MKRINRLLGIVLIAFIFLGNTTPVFAQTEQEEDTIGKRLSISYSGEEYFAEEFDRAYKTYKTGFALFWAGIGLTALSAVIGGVAISLDDRGVIDTDTSKIMTYSSFAIIGLSSIVVVTGANAWWNGNHRLLSLIESREKFFTLR